MQRNITHEDVEVALLNGEIIENYEEYQSYLVLYFNYKKQHNFQNNTMYCIIKKIF